MLRPSQKTGGLLPYILSLDQGTTSSRALLFDHERRSPTPSPSASSSRFSLSLDGSSTIPKRSRHHRSRLPWKPWPSQAQPSDVAAIGITNQRETTIVWDRSTGKPIYNAIVWQDRRTAAFCDQLKAQGHENLIQQRTGLLIDAYFSASKISWILEHVPNARQLAEAGRLAFGTVDTWLLWKLTGGRVHVTDASNASRTMLFNLHSGKLG